jgi:hypothetical protein
MTAVAAPLSIEDLEQQPESVEQFLEPPRQVRITLSASATAPLRLDWNIGGKTGRNTTLFVKPGGSVVQPLAKAEVWLGPFSTPERYLKAKDEAERSRLKDFWRLEKARVLNKWDYPRPQNHMKDGTNPTGPHRFPDVSVTILEADGSELEPMRLHQLYKLGEFDNFWTPDKFGPAESSEDVRAEYEARIAAQAAQHETEKSEMLQRLAKLEGMVGAVISSGKAEANANRSR